MVKTQSSLDKYLPGYEAPPRPQESFSKDGIKLVEYKAFTTSARPSYICFKPGVLNVINEQDHAFPHSAMTVLQTDGNGFHVMLIYSLPTPGPIVVRISGKGLAPLVDAILDGTAREVQVFDPARFLPVPEGDWDVLAHRWDGKPLVESMVIVDKPIAPENKPAPDAKLH